MPTRRPANPVADRGAIAGSVSAAPYSTSARSKAFSAARCAAAPTRIWAASSTCIVDRTGQVRAAVIDFGGFLGVGSRKIAVDWSALRFPRPGKRGRIALDSTRDQVKAAPEYQEGKPVVVLGARQACSRMPEYARTPER